jgi:hypothetical protein
MAHPLHFAFGQKRESEAAMIVEQTKQKCAHEGCVCEVHSSQSYCSPYCATAAAEHEVTHEHGPCECGHAACKPRARDAV